MTHGLVDPPRRERLEPSRFRWLRAIHRLSLTAIAALTLAHTHAARADEIRLRAGDVLIGTIIERSADALTLQHSLLGVVRIPIAEIAPTIITSSSTAAPIPTPSTTPSTAPSQQADPITTTTTTTAAITPAAPSTDDRSFWSNWRGSVDLGVNGSEGNSENFAARGTLAAKRVTPTLETIALFRYIYVTDNGIKSKSRGDLNLRNDWLWTSSPWGFFAEGKLEYDEFQPWALRSSLFLGPSYTFWSTETTTLRGRAGLGVTREFGSQRNQFLPEALFGLDAAHRLSDRSRLFGSTEVLPNLADFPEHRTETRLGYELLVDPQTHLNVKFGVTSRYNSDPGETDDGRAIKSNDVEYFITVGWDF